MVFDPTQISYGQLLEVFWSLHEPTSSPYLTQYRNAIFFLDTNQKREAEISRDEVSRNIGKPVRTAIEAAGAFTAAEDYHQKHYLKKVIPLLDILRKRYPDKQQLFRSTEAARLNGFFGCHGDPGLLGEELRSFNLPPTLEHDLFDTLTLTCRNFRDKGCSLPPLP